MFLKQIPNKKSGKTFLPSFTAGETVASPNSLTQQSVRDYFFVKLCIFCYLPFCIVVV